MKKLLRNFAKKFCEKRLIYESFNKSEELVKLFFRLNGYFMIDNFILHNGNADISKSNEKIIPQLTETDIICVRLPFHKEIAGFQFQNFDKILLNNNLIDIIIIETKTNNSDKPNKTWKNDKKVENVEYLLNFIGFTDDTNIIKEAALNLVNNYHYIWEVYSLRYVIVSERANEHYEKKGVTYILFNEVINFIINTRGSCWIEHDIGISSDHAQWNPFIKKIFDIANNTSISQNNKKNLLWKMIK